MQCYQCGEEVLREAVFCHRCGARLDGSHSAAEDGPERPADPREPDDSSRDASSSPPDSFRNSVAQRKRDSRESDREETLWEGSYASKAMLSRWIFSALATAGGLVVAIMWPHHYVWIGFGAFVLLLWSYQAFVLVSRQMSVHYRLTNQRFVHQTGILRRVTDRVELIDVDDITFEQGMIDRLVGVGSIRISSSDRTHPELVLAGIEDVARVAGLIDETVRAERRRRGLFVEHV